MSGANREYVDRTCLHDEVCIYREEHMRKGAERMNKSRVTEYILAYMQEKGISASEISEQTQVPEEKLHPDYPQITKEQAAVLARCKRLLEDEPQEA